MITYIYNILMNLGHSCLESQIEKLSSVIRSSGHVTLTVWY